MSQPQRDPKGRFLTGHTANAYTDEELQVIIRHYCRHRALGFDKESFRHCHYETLERFAARSPETADALRIAEAKCWYFWESILRGAAMGMSVEIPDYNTPGGKSTILPGQVKARLLILIVRNKLRGVYGRGTTFTVEPERYIPSPIQVIEPESIYPTI